MGDKSLIEWTDATWNPVVGCDKVSPGCDNCYAVRATARTRPGVPFERVELYSSRLDQPLRWRRPRRIFVNSLSDLFHDAVPVGFIVEVFAVMAASPQHQFQVLTKRPGRMASLLNHPGFWVAVANAISASPVRKERVMGNMLWRLPTPRHPLPNVWLGVSVENQQWADVRIPKLLETPAAVRFLSCEPLLGPVDLALVEPIADSEIPGSALNDGVPMGNAVRRRGIHWVIVGGESGPGARPMHPDWVRSLRDQCVAAGVPFFFKQWGEYVIGDGPLEPYRADNPDAWRAGSHLVRIGKKRAGRELDGRTWDEMPAAEGAFRAEGRP